MLLATIHGKVFADADDNEDWLTSAVFGHLRGLPICGFWEALLDRAKTASEEASSLSGKLRQEGIDLGLYACEMRFWPKGRPFGEPDLLLRFRLSGSPTIVVLVEVKLRSGKSGTGEEDQLAKYLRFLDQDEPLPGCVSQHKYLIYLTVSEGDAALIESAKSYGESSASERLFGLHWSDVQEVASEYSSQAYLLDEVARFLDLRNLSPFQGYFRETLALPHRFGSFYQESYFETSALKLDPNLGAFYG